MSDPDLPWARRVDGPQPEGWRIWLTPERLLIARGEKGAETYAVKDLKTGVTRPAAGLNGHYRNWNHAHLDLSPDGRRALWRGTDDRLHVATIDAPGRSWSWRDDLDLHADLLWLPDSRRFVVLDTRHRQAILYDLLRRPRARLPLPGGFPADAMTRAGTVLGAAPEGGRLLLTEAALLPTPRITQRQGLRLPRGASVDEIAIERGGKRLALALRIPSGALFAAVVSPRDGEWRFLAQLPGEGPRLAWTPEGRRLSFVWKDILWTMPT